MILKILKLIIIIAVATGAAILIYPSLRRSSEIGINSEIKISTSTSNFVPSEIIRPEKESAPKEISEKPKISSENSKYLQESSNSAAPIVNQKILISLPPKEVSDKSFEVIINSSVIQLYCGNLSSDGMSFSDISRGTGIIIDDSGRLLTNRHVIYDENLKKIKNNCFVLKSPFPNSDSQKPKIYYKVEVLSYPLLEKFSDSFSKDKYYNDFAVLKIFSKVSKESKINLLLGFDYALPEDYLILENELNKYNYLPIDWNYQPRNNDVLITLGYGIDASHLANKITSTIGNISGNININGKFDPQILLIESNATTGFSGGALINPESKGLVGLVSWITAGDVTGKYTVAIFRDFLRNLMIQDLNFDLKLMQN